MDGWTLESQKPRRSIVGLVADLWRESALLIREEIELVKTEVAEEIARARIGMVSIAAGGAISIVGLIFILVALVQLLTLILPEDQAPWLSPLIVGGCVTLVGAGLVCMGIRQFSTDGPPLSHVRRSVKRDAQLVKEHIS
jgi:uncharacterized membrane protein YqjE